MTADFVVAVDVGGTLTKIAYADRAGSLTGLTRMTTELTAGGAGLVTWLAATIRRAVEREAEACVGFGVVVPGIVDAANGIVRAAPNVNWFDVPLLDRLTALTGLTGLVGHDVRAGGLAEWRLGSGRGSDNLLFLSLGTGVAGAMVVDGRMLQAGGFAGEIGHTRIPAAGEVPCACGQVGCLETVASAAGVTRTYARLAGSAEHTDTQHVAELARRGDPIAGQSFDLAARALTEALAIYVSLLGPELIVIGGGLSGAADLLLPQLVTGLESTLTFQRLPRIVVASLGADAGVIGAGLLGWAAFTAEPHSQATPSPSRSRRRE